jgi:proteasome lid subunit RPN8/RPN11
MFDLEGEREIEITKQIKDKIKNKSELSVNKQFNVAATMSICKDIIIVVPEKIEDILKELDIRFRHVEYSIFCQSDRIETSELGDTLFIYLKDTYYIPEQSVSAAFVNYEEDHKDYDTVIHKHPDGCMSFSGTDREFINSNFDYSLLFVNKSFQTGNARIPINSEKTIYITMSAKVKVERIIKRVEIPEDQLAKIKQRIVIHGSNETIPKNTYLEYYGSRFGRYTGNQFPDLNQNKKEELNDDNIDDLFNLLNEDNDGIPDYNPKKKSWF